MRSVYLDGRERGEMGSAIVRVDGSDATSRETRITAEKRRRDLVGAFEAILCVEKKNGGTLVWASPAVLSDAAWDRLFDAAMGKNTLRDTSPDPDRGWANRGEKDCPI